MTPDLAASITAKLSVLARARGNEFQNTLTRYGVERFLYRLSVTHAREVLWLKGALLFDLWFSVSLRPTRDADFLGLGPLDAATLLNFVRGACAVEVADGMTYDPGSAKAREIREDGRYGGLRITLLGRLKNARCPVQLDVGYGDAVTPGPEEVTLPTLLDGLPAPSLHVYPRATVVAEKLEAIVSLGMANTRMKDYFDLRALAHEGAVDANILASAIAATFGRRGTPIPEDPPLGLTDEFATDRLKQSQWVAFLKRNRLDAPPLAEVVEEVRSLVQAPLRMALRRLPASETPPSET